MRTATTLFRTVKGWSLAAGPDVPADRQRRQFNDPHAWPEGILEVQWQPSDGPARTRTKEKALSIVSLTAKAAKRADEKAALAKKREEEAVAQQIKDDEAKRKADAEIREREVKAKEARKQSSR